MSYLGSDPGDVENCPVCGFELWPFPAEVDHSSCKRELERIDREFREFTSGGQLELNTETENDLPY
jgi:hypothetical protein